MYEGIDQIEEITKQYVTFDSGWTWKYSIETRYNSRPTGNISWHVGDLGWDEATRHQMMHEALTSWVNDTRGGSVSIQAWASNKTYCIHNYQWHEEYPEASGQWRAIETPDAETLFSHGEDWGFIFDPESFMTQIIEAE